MLDDAAYPVLGLTVIIPVRDGSKYLAGCLESLLRSSHRPAEVIVVDDGSVDESEEVARQFGARVVSMAAQRGPAAARNAGAKAAGQPVLMFLDADVMVHPDTLYRAYKSLTERENIGAVFGAYDDAPSAPGLVSQYRNLMHHFTHFTSNRKASTFWAGCGIIHRDLFLSNGGFDEGFRVPCVEDTEFGIRLSHAGVEIRLDPEVQVCHAKAWTLWSMMRTDILWRAWPWSRLLLSLGILPNDLNLRWEQRAGALFAWLGLVFACGAVDSPAALFGVGGCAAGVAVCSARLLQFLARVRGKGFAARAFSLHCLFLLYSSATFAAAAATYYLRPVQPSPSVIPKTRPEVSV